MSCLSTVSSSLGQGQSVGWFPLWWIVHVKAGTRQLISCTFDNILTVFFHITLRIPYARRTLVYGRSQTAMFDELRFVPRLFLCCGCQMTWRYLAFLNLLFATEFCLQSQSWCFLLSFSDNVSLDAHVELCRKSWPDPQWHKPNLQSWSLYLHAVPTPSLYIIAPPLARSRMIGHKCNV